MSRGDDPSISRKSRCRVKIKNKAVPRGVAAPLHCNILPDEKRISALRSRITPSRCVATLSVSICCLIRCTGQARVQQWEVSPYMGERKIVQPCDCSVRMSLFPVRKNLASTTSIAPNLQPPTCWYGLKASNSSTCGNHNVIVRGVRTSLSG